MDKSYSTMLYITAGGHGICEVDSDVGYSLTGLIPTTEQLANAHLIAAAPDMYKFIDDLIHDKEIGGWECFLARKLLAKARGEE